MNELRFDKRTKRENIILAAIWFEKDKPIPNLLLEPLVPRIMERRQGVHSEHVHVKGIIKCGTCDIPAKAPFLHMNQYNGRAGC